ncbi:MAG: glycosyltransferase family 4 protein [Microthrixaceae bacterium]
MRVLAVLPGLNGQGGAEQSFVVTAPLLMAEGIGLELALLTDRRIKVPEVEAMGVRVHDLSGSRGVPGRARELARLVKGSRPDLVHATLFDAEVAASLAVLPTRTPLLVTWATTTQTSASEGGVAPWKLKVVEAEQVAMGRIARTRYQAVTPGVGRSRGTALRVPAARIRVAERGRDTARFAGVDPGRVEEVRAELGLAPTDRIVLVVARLEPAKGLERVLAAVDRLVEQVPEAVVLVAGRDGTAAGRLESQRRGLAHGDQVRFLGHRDDVPVLLHAADCWLSTSHREGAAGGMLEAWASGCPVVIVPVDGIEGVAVDGRNALVAAPEDVAGAVARVLGDPDLAASLAAAGREDFASRFTVERSAERLAEVYRWAATRGRSG